MWRLARPARKDLLGLAVALVIAVVAVVALLAAVLYLLTIPLIDWLGVL